jgi:hypothetical protein
MNRRDLLVLTALAVAPRAVRPKQAHKLPVIGVLNPGFPTYDAAGAGLTDGATSATLAFASAQI